MSNKNDDFWKELMGEDFKVQDLDEIAKTPEKPPAKQEAPQGEKSFTIEFVNRDGKSVPSPEPKKPQEPAPKTPQAERRPETPKAFDATRIFETPKAPEVTRTPQTPKAPEVKRTPETPKTPEVKRPSETPIAPEAARAPEVKKPPEPAKSQDAPEEAPWFVTETELNDDAPKPAPRGQRGGKKNPEDDFEVEFDFDSEYADVDEKAVRRGRTRRTGCLSGILMFLFIICVSVVLASLGWLWATDVLGLDGEDELVEVTLPKEIFHTEEREQEDKDGNKTTVTVTVADIDKVAEELYNKGLIRYKWLFKLFSKFFDTEIKVKAGTFTLNMNYDYRAIVSAMNPYTGKRNEVWVTVPEGYSLTQIVALIESKGVCDSASMLDALANYDFNYDFLDSSTLGDPKRLEGYMFPDSYIFYEDDDAPNVIAKFLNNFEVKWTEEFDQQAQELGYTMDEIITVASMIEKEAGADTERDSIASVIYNRLEHPEYGTNGYLQIDATIYYVIADTGEDFSTEIDSPYNTYKYPGLPVGPISNPGIASIRAALNPANTNYFYYALGKDGLHRFFETYDGFINFVNSAQYGG